MTAMAASLPDMQQTCLEAMIADPQYGALIAPLGSVSARTPQRLKMLSDLAAHHDNKPICVPFIGGWIGGPGTGELDGDPHVCWFNSVKRCVGKLDEWHRRDDRRLLEAENGPRRTTRAAPEGAGSPVSAILRAARSRALTGRKVREILAFYEIPGISRIPAHAATVQVNARIDELFGPLVEVTLLKDSALELAPMTLEEALTLLHRLGSAAALDGYRGYAPVDMVQLAGMIVRIAEFAQDQQENLESLAVQLICAGGGIAAGDAHLIRRIC